MRGSPRTVPQRTGSSRHGPRPREVELSLTSRDLAAKPRISTSKGTRSIASGKDCRGCSPCLRRSHQPGWAHTVLMPLWKRGHSAWPPASSMGTDLPFAAKPGRAVREALSQGTGSLSSSYRLFIWRASPLEIPALTEPSCAPVGGDWQHSPPCQDKEAQGS